MNKFLSLHFFYFSIVCLLSGLFHCSSNISGSEVKNERAVVYLPDGKTPAVSAKMELIPLEFIPGEEVENPDTFSTYTDTLGEYKFLKIPQGLYTLSSKKDSLASFIDSLYIDDSTTFPSDTLKKTGSYTAKVVMQTNHNPQTVTVQVLGTTYFTNVDSSGLFTINGVGEGTYRLRLITTLPDYTHTFTTADVKIEKVKPVPEIDLIYTGIPVVNNLKAFYDPVTKTISVSWDPVNYDQFSQYIIYRDSSENPVLSTTPYAAVSDTIFIDSLSHLTPDTGTIIYQFRYRIAAQNHSMKIGEPYRYVDCTVILSSQSPTLFTRDTISFYPKKEFTIHIQPYMDFGKIQSYYLSLGESNKFTQFSGPDTTIIMDIPGDSIVTGYPCVVKAINNFGIELQDTLFLQSHFFWTRISDTPNETAIGYYSTEFDGRFLSFIETGSNDAATKCELWSSNDAVNWSKISDSLPFNSLDKPPLVFQNKIFVFCRDTSDSNAQIWYTEDINSWTYHNIDSISNIGYNQDYEIWTSVNDKIVLTNYYPECLAENECSKASNWTSSDGLNWKMENILNSTFSDLYDTPNINFTACEFDGQLVIGGAWRSLYLCYPVWSAYTLKIWENLKSNPKQIAFPNPVDQNEIGVYNPALVVYNNRLFLTSQINMEHSTEITANTKYLWVLLSDNSWYLCSNTYPAENNKKMKSNYHSICVYKDTFYSISNSGIYYVKH